MDKAIDTQFAGFAKLLTKDLMQTNALDKVDASRFWDEDDRAEVENVIAQRAYDIAIHVIEHVSEYSIAAVDTGMETPCGAMRDVPDMNEWPKESND